MGLFGKKKEKCCCASCDPQTVAQVDPVQTTKGIKVLGSGCAKCNALEAAVVEALNELKMDASIEHVTDFAQIAAYGVMSTPALVVDGQVVSYGKVLNKEQAKDLIQKVRGE